MNIDLNTNDWCLLMEAALAEARRTRSVALMRLAARLHGEAGLAYVSACLGAQASRMQAERAGRLMQMANTSAPSNSTVAVIAHVDGYPGRREIITAAASDEQRKA